MKTASIRIIAAFFVLFSFAVFARAQDEQGHANAVTVRGGDTLQILDDAYWQDEKGISRRQTNLFRFVGVRRELVRITDLRTTVMRMLKVSPDKTKVLFLRSGSTADVPQDMLCVYDLADMRMVKVPISVWRAEWTSDGSRIVATARSLHHGTLGLGRWVVMVDSKNGKIVAGKRVTE